MADFRYRPRPKGADGKIEIEVERNGRPHGLIWTWEVPEEFHPWHAKPLNGSHHTYLSLEKAKYAMERN